MAKITQAGAVHDLGVLVKAIMMIVNGAVEIGDFTDSGVRALLLDMLQDEIDDLRQKWCVKAGGNDGK